MKPHETWDLERWHRERGTVPHKPQPALKPVNDQTWIELPYPPSVNHYWRMWKGKMLISRKGNEYRRNVEAVVLASGWRRREGRLSVLILAMMPDKRCRDIDNLCKSLLDAGTHAGLWQDDNQIDRLVIQRGAVEPPGKIILSVETIP